MAHKKIEDLIGLTLKEIRGAKQYETEVTFVTTDDRRFMMFHEQDCCETVSVEEIIGDVEDLIGSPIAMAEEVSEVKPPGPDGWGDQHWTFYKLGTAKGVVTFRWMGDSEYYSTDVSFEEIK